VVFYIDSPFQSLSMIIVEYFSEKYPVDPFGSDSAARRDA
jgi:hypothetical protein